MKNRRTKIVATIGPSSESVTMLVRMIRAGMDVARLNFSHGDHKSHLELIKNIRRASKKAKKTVAILQDLQGPKIRLGVLSEAGIDVKNGQILKLNTAIKEYSKKGELPVTYNQLHKDVRKGHRLFFDDGMIETEIIGIKGRVISIKVKNDGHLISHKGINIPDSKIAISSFTAKDREDLMFGLKNNVDWVALSFVVSPEVVKKVKNIVQVKSKKLKIISPKIVVKIERREAVDDFENILDVADGVMIARGDLGVAIPSEEVPIVQKELVEMCRQAGKPVIVATQMLQSMTQNPRATRAEVSDVANAVIDHADATMLSNETAVGEYPYASVKTMEDIILEIEDSRFDDLSFYQIYDVGDIPTSIAQTLHIMVENNHLDLIVSSVTYYHISGSINIFRPNVPIILACPNEAIVRQVSLRAGITGVILNDARGTFIYRMEAKLRKEKWIKKNSKVAYLTSSASGEIQMIIR